MDHKKELKKLVETVKESAKSKGKRITNKEIAERFGIKRTYLSDLLGVPGRDVTEKHIKSFKLAFQEELNNVEKPAPAGDKLNRERAIIKVLLHEVARLKAKDEGITEQEALAELKRSTNLVLDDLDDL